MPRPQPPVTRRSFTARYRRGARQGVWLVDLVEEPRVHTYGHGLAQARENIVDATTLWYELDRDQFELLEDIVLPRGAKTKASQARRDRDRAEAAATRAAESIRAAVQALAGDRGGLSVRDAGEVLGLSYQRVAQLLAD